MLRDNLTNFSSCLRSSYIHMYFLNNSIFSLLLMYFLNNGSFSLLSIFDCVFMESKFMGDLRLHIYVQNKKHWILLATEVSRRSF